MKKILILLAALTFVLGSSPVNAVDEPNADDYIIEQDINDKTKFIPLDNNGNEFKFRYKGKFGYYNKNNNAKLITDADNLYLLGNNYLKVKKDGKYGVIDKTGQSILPPVCQKINLITTQDDEYFLVKYEGVHKLIHTSGEFVPDNEISSVPGTSVYMLANDIKPEIVEFYMDNLTVNEQSKNLDSEKETTAVNNTEQTSEPIPAVSSQPSEYEIEVPDNVEVAAVEKNVQQEDIETTEEQKPSESSFRVNNKEYILVYSNNKFGIKNNKQEQVLPVEYDSITLKKLNNLFKTQVLLTLKNNSHYIYDLKGNLLAEKKDDQIFVYDMNNTYTATFSDKTGQLSKNGNLKALIMQENNDFIYSQLKFGLPVPKKVKELVNSMILISK